MYNIQLKRERLETDCVSCPCYDNKTKSCKGINKICFEYDKKIMTIIDGVTKMPLKGDKYGNI